MKDIHEVKETQPLSFNHAGVWQQKCAFNILSGQEAGPEPEHTHILFLKEVHSPLKFERPLEVHKCTAQQSTTPTHFLCKSTTTQQPFTH